MAEMPYLTLLLLLLNLSFSASTISLGSVLYASGSNQSWSSPSFTFSVSFAPSSSSPGSFLAAVSFAGNVPIWSPGSVDSLGSLRLFPSGSLCLIDGSNTTIWDSGTESIGIVSASIEDSGNLVLLNNQSIPVWSSFDHPTDTIVQSQNFSVRTILRSGDYSFQLETSGNLTLRWKNITTYWYREITPALGSKSNLSSLSLSLLPNGAVVIYDSTFSGRAKNVFSFDSGESENTFRFVKLGDDGNLRLYSSECWSKLVNQVILKNKEKGNI